MLQVFDKPLIYRLAWALVVPGTVGGRLVVTKLSCLLCCKFPPPSPGLLVALLLVIQLVLIIPGKRGQEFLDT